jgi:hypothetical protein
VEYQGHLVRVAAASYERAFQFYGRVFEEILQAAGALDKVEKLQGVNLLVGGTTSRNTRFGLLHPLFEVPNLRASRLAKHRKRGRGVNNLDKHLCV